MADDGLNNGGPAFPCHTNPRPGFLSNAPQGMTLRDWFAGQALAGLMADGYPTDTSLRSRVRSHVASAAYDIADAMLAERERDQA